jgi:hypothetical protein
MNSCRLQYTCTHGDVCESKIENVAENVACYNRIKDEEKLFETGEERREPKQELLF